MTKNEYRAYLQSDHWRSVRKAALWRAQNRCQSPICRYGEVRAWTDAEIHEELGGVYRLDVHHLTYERLGHELPDDLLVLCRDCHELIHGKQIIPEHEESYGFGDKIDEVIRKSSRRAIYARLRSRR